MKFTSEMLMKAMGLDVGDSVKVALTPNHYAIFTLVNDENEGLSLISKEKEFYPVEFLVDLDFQILSKSKRVGNTNGDDYKNCINCPLRLFDYCGNYCDGNLSLYEVLEEATKYVKRKGLFDQEIYNIFKKRLDKEVEE